MTSLDADAQKKQYKNFSNFHLYVFILFSIELVTGLFLSISYRASNPYATDGSLHSGFFRYCQAFHYWSSSLLIVFALLLSVVDIWTLSFRGPNRFIFVANVLVFLSSLGFQITGNLLSNDRHGVQTANIEASIAARMPLVGADLRSLFIGGPQFGPHTVILWFEFHLLCTLLAILVGVAAWLGRSAIREGISKPLIGGLFLPPVLLTVLVASPFGSRSTDVDINAFADRPSWYTLPLHGSLSLAERVNPSLGWIGAILIPGFAALLLVAVPWIGSKLSPKFLRSGLVFGIGYFLIASIGEGGAIDSLVGTRDPVELGNSIKPANVPPVDKTVAAAGRQLFNQPAIGCASCHGQDGLSGGAGPSLKDVYKQHPDAGFYEKYVANPKSIDPGSTMPAFNGQLNQTQLKEIAEYLRSSAKS